MESNARGIVLAADAAAVVMSGEEYNRGASAAAGQRYRNLVPEACPGNDMIKCFMKNVCCKSGVVELQVGETMAVGAGRVGLQAGRLIK